MFTKKNDKEKTLVSNLKYLIGKEDKLKEKLEDNSYLEPFSDDLMLFMSLIKDYYKGDYRKIPFRTISAGVVGAIYTLNPIDLIPDSIPFIGYIDDALVLKFCLKQARKDLQNTSRGNKNNQAPKAHRKMTSTQTRSVMITAALMMKMTMKPVLISKRLHN